MKKLVIKKSSRGALDISFGLIFAIIVGAMILALAILVANKLGKMQTYEQEGETTKTIAILTNPLESSFESMKKVAIITPARTRIYTSCRNDTGFGKQIFQTSQEKYGKWEEPEREILFENKYIFSESPVEGKKFYIFSKAFDFPFKVGDLIYITSSETTYCFRDAPDKEVEKELELINQTNILTKNCPPESVKVCFLNKPNCDIKVSYNEEDSSGYVSKDNKRMYFQGNALMYAAIFSEPETYECQAKRLINRAEVLTEIYLNKNNRASQELNCGNEFTGDLILFKNLLGDFSDSSELGLLREYSDNLRLDNSYGGCPLW